MKKGIPQEVLKLIACVTMLLDHIGAVWGPNPGLRLVGRLAFPIFCFLLAEGTIRTHDPRQYGLRLAVVAILSEVPFDFLLHGGFTWEYQSVMVTLLLGFVMLMAVRKARTDGLKFLAVVVTALSAEWLRCDYGGAGIFIIALFAATRRWKDGLLFRILGQAAIWWMRGGSMIMIGFVAVPMQIFATASMVPIAFYSGEKLTKSRAVQWAFYLFYPVHLAILLLIAKL